MLRKNLLFLFLTFSSQISWAGSTTYALTERVSVVSPWVYYLIGFCLLLLATAKFINAEIFTNFSYAFASIKGMFMLEKEGWNTLKNGGWLLMLNFFVTASLGFYLFLEDSNINPWLSFGLVVYYLLQLFVLFSTSLLVGKFKRFFHSFRSFTLVHQMLGIALIPLILIWILNDGGNNVFNWVFLGLYLVFQLYKIFRGFVIAIRQNFEWYYIILYLCTLEILPILVLMRTLGGEI